jgi:hypothetical protein
MPATLMIHDETTSGQKTNSFTIECLTDRITGRELIRARIYQEVQDYSLKEPEYFHGLVQPRQAEKVVNGYKLHTKRKIDWHEQYQRAIEAFDRNGFFVLVGDKQAESLDQEFDVKVDMEVSFVRLMPLVLSLASLQDMAKRPDNAKQTATWPVGVALGLADDGGWVDAF